MTRVKICGLRSFNPTIAAAAMQADLLGLVFEHHSRRCLEVEDARRMVESFRACWPHGKPLWVGVFANQPLEEVNHVLDYCNLDMAQISGQESPDYCRQVVRPVIKVIHVRDDLPPDNALEGLERSLRTYLEEGHMCLLDTFKKGIHGGTGQVFDWTLARELSRSYPFLLAGGLSPQNVAEAIRQVEPWGVDVSSGVETNGEKSPAKVARFIARVRQADQVLEETAQT